MVDSCETGTESFVNSATPSLSMNSAHRGKWD